MLALQHIYIYIGMPIYSTERGQWHSAELINSRAHWPVYHLSPWRLTDGDRETNEYDFIYAAPKTFYIHVYSPLHLHRSRVARYRGRRSLIPTVLRVHQHRRGQMCFPMPTIYYNPRSGNARRKHMNHGSHSASSSSPAFTIFPELTTVHRFWMSLN